MSLKMSRARQPPTAHQARTAPVAAATTAMALALAPRANPRPTERFPLMFRLWALSLLDSYFCVALCSKIIRLRIGLSRRSSDLIGKVDGVSFHSPFVVPRICNDVGRCPVLPVDGTLTVHIEIYVDRNVNRSFGYLGPEVRTTA